MFVREREKKRGGGGDEELCLLLCYLKLYYCSLVERLDGLQCGSGRENYLTHPMGELGLGE